MDVLTAMKNRTSFRSFLDEPVPVDLIKNILEDASRAPSALNMQPWEINVVLGSERKRLSKKLLKAFKERGITCGPGAARPLPETFMLRARKCAEDMTPLINSMGQDFKKYVNEGSLGFYGAPCVIFVFLDESFPCERMVDVGSFLGFLVLAASARGLGSCPIGLVTSYDDEIRDFLNISDSKKLAISIAIGKPDLSKSINNFKTIRAPLSETVRWVD